MAKVVSAIAATVEFMFQSRCRDLVGCELNLRKRLSTKPISFEIGHKPHPQEWSADQKHAIAAKVEQNADLLRFCLEIAQRKFGELVAPEDLRCLATTLFLSAIK